MVPASSQVSVRAQSCSSIPSSSSSSGSSSGDYALEVSERHHPESLTASSPSKQRLGARGLRAHVAVSLYSSVCLSLLVLLLYLSFFAARMDDAAGLTDPRPEFLSCRSWGFGTSCGLWGVDCRPFESDWGAFRCPDRCNLGTTPMRASIAVASPLTPCCCSLVRPIVRPRRLRIRTLPSRLADLPRRHPRWRHWCQWRLRALPLRR